MGAGVRQHTSDEPTIAQLSERCPCSPSAPASTHGETFDPGFLDLSFLALYSASRASRPHPETRKHPVFDRSKQKRGPPPTFLPA